MRLLAVELRRLFARRAVVVLLVASMLGAVTVTAIAVWNARPPSDADIAAAEADLERWIQRPAVQRRYDSCLTRADSDLAEQRCERQLPRLEWFLYSEPFEPRQVFRDLAIGLTVLVGFGAVMVGTTAIGAEFSSGAIAPLLLVRPRRLPVWAAKLTATGLGVGVVGLLAWAAAVAIVLAAGVGVVVGYLVLAEAVGRAAAADAIAPWLLSHHVLGVVLGRFVVQDYSACELRRPSDGDCPELIVFTQGSSTLVLAVVGAVVLLVSAVAFQRRDVS